MTKEIKNDAGFKSDVVIGLEIHVELNTETKLFCSCKTFGDDFPNSRTCTICLGHPGSKPVSNKKALEKAHLLSRALNCMISENIVFSRKSYFYPDLAKNYQITQYEEPLGTDGWIRVNGRKIGISRVHVEEDPASLVHPAGIGKSSYVLIDYNRSGNPLCEIVTKPEIENAGEARDFLKKLITILEYIGIYDKRCVIKCDANVSLKENDYERVEIKNISSFKEIERAINYEVERQKQEKVEGMETRAWDSVKGFTYSLRKKESEEDYGYIFEPDLVPIDVSELDTTKLPELPDEKEERLKGLGLSEEDSCVISSDFGLVKIFEKVSKKINPVLAGKWIRRELVKVANYNEIGYDKIDIDEFIKLLKSLEEKKITDKVAQKILERLAKEKFDVLAYVKKEGLETINDSFELETFCTEAISENKKAADDFRSGKEEALNFLLGAVMKKSRGKASASEVRDMLKKLILP